MIPCNFSVLKQTKQHLIGVTSFRFTKSLYSRSVLFKCTNNFVFIVPNLLEGKIYDTKCPTHVTFLFSHFLFFHISCTSVLQTFLLFVTVAVLLRYQYPANCRRSNVEDIFTYTVYYRYCVHRPGLKYL